ncbi:MAG TPA: ATP-binding protein [Anaerolineales bacterium]|nr:ATP-binding protein [Anaerolineales bacterium]
MENEFQSQEMLISSDLLAQRSYLDQLRQDDFDFGLMVADAFINGIRDIGYRNTATALDELVDNSIQAEAQNIHVLFGLEGQSKTINRIAVVDDGHGMDPDMIRISMTWGGTHRWNDRKGFGRYGYGLPSASLSQGKRFSVYSKVPDGEWYKNTLDVDDISAGKYNHDGKTTIPASKPADLPAWLKEQVLAIFGSAGLKHGTAVVIENLDRNDWKREATAASKLLEHFGLIYRNFVLKVNVFVNRTKVEPIDPLFITPGFRFHELNGTLAKPLEPAVIAIKNPITREIQGYIKIRFAYLPYPGFTSKDPSNVNEKNHNERFEVMKETNGLIVLRNGRQIEVLNRMHWRKRSSDDVADDDEEFKASYFSNNDRYIKIEVDFPAVLDEDFSVTTSKQTVSLSDRIWDALEQAGVRRTMAQLRKMYGDDSALLKNERAEPKDKTTRRASEEAMVEAAKFKEPLSTDVSTAQQKRADENLEKEAKKIADQTKMPIEEVKHQKLLEAEQRPFKVEFEHLPESPFYRVVQLGGQKILYINRAHPFYTEIYSSDESGPYLKAALEVLLFVIGDSELDAFDERLRFYQIERGRWSTSLATTLQRLGKLIVTHNESENA